MSNDETKSSPQEESSDKKVSSVPKERFDQVWAKSKNEEEKRRNVEGKLAEKDAEIQRLELKATQSELVSKYPKANKYLEDNPELGLVAESKEEYIEKMKALDEKLGQGDKPKEGEEPSEKKEPEAEGEEKPEEKKGFVAPNPPSKEASSEANQDVTNMHYSEYGKLPEKERTEFLRAVTEQANKK